MELSTGGAEKEEGAEEEGAEVGTAELTVFMIAEEADPKEAPLSINVTIAKVTAVQIKKKYMRIL